MEIKEVLTGLKNNYEKKTGKPALDPIKNLYGVSPAFMFYVVEFYEVNSRDVVRQLKEIKKNNSIAEAL